MSHGKTMRAHLLFMRARTFGTPFIRVMTWSDWSHVALVTPDGCAYESRFPDGVVVGPYMQLIDRASRFQFASISLAPSARVFLDLQLGAPYDWTAVLGIGLHRDWQEPDSWFCSELVAAACACGGRPLVTKQFGRVTPQDCYQSPVIRLLPRATIPANLTPVM